MVFEFCTQKLHIMKKISILLLFLVPLALVSFKMADQKEELKWESWNTGYEKGKKEKKIILIDAYTEWCGWCKKMDRDTYTNADVIKKINEHFVPVKFNPELDQKYMIDGKEVSGFELLGLLSQNNRTGYPTTFFLVTTKNTVYIEPGYQNAEKFLVTLDNMIAQQSKQP